MKEEFEQLQSVFIIHDFWFTGKQCEAMRKLWLIIIHKESSFLDVYTGLLVSGHCFLQVITLSPYAALNEYLIKKEKEKLKHIYTQFVFELP